MNSSNLRFRLPLSCFVLLSAIGCTTTDSSDPFRSTGRADFAVRRLPGVSLTELRPVARQIFQTYYRIDPVASTEDTLVSFPTEITHEAQRERVSDMLAVSPRRHRRLTSLQIFQEGSGTVIRCRVQNQRLDAAERAAFARTRGHQGDDRPTETPIDRSGGTAPRTREEWVNAGRDRAAEQQLLDAIARAFEPDEPDAAP